MFKMELSENPFMLSTILKFSWGANISTTLSSDTEYNARPKCPHHVVSEDFLHLTDALKQIKATQKLT